MDLGPLSSSGFLGNAVVFCWPRQCFSTDMVSTYPLVVTDKTLANLW